MVRGGRVVVGVWGFSGAGMPPGNPTPRLTGMEWSVVERRVVCVFIVECDTTVGRGRGG